MPLNKESKPKNLRAVVEFEKQQNYKEQEILLK